MGREAAARPTAVVLAAVLAASAVARPARAVDPFEIQVYDGTANAPRVAGLEVHANAIASGPRDGEPSGSEARDTEREGHLTFEPSLGVLPWWELGAYLQTARLADGSYRYAGWKLRSKLVTAPGWRPHLRLGLNFEVAQLPAEFDPERWGAEVRPIVAWEDERWLLAMNPILDAGLSARALGAGPSLEPCAAAKRKLRAGDAGLVVAVGLEYYAGLGPLSSPLRWREQQHQLFETVDLAWRALDLDLELGVGEGLTATSDAVVVKLIAGFAFPRAR